VATITLNRPEAMNSLDVATKVLLLETIRQVAEDPAARCVVLTGTGRAFCTGQDLKEHVQLLQSGSSDELFRTVDEHYNPIVTALAGMAKPVIAGVNGVAAGAGASLAFACDLRILADEVRQLAVRLAAGPTVALGALRQSLEYAADHTFEEALAFESRMMAKTGATADHTAAVAAFLAKQKPVFEGR